MEEGEKHKGINMKCIQSVDDHDIVKRVKDELAFNMVQKGKWKYISKNEYRLKRQVGKMWEQRAQEYDAHRTRLPHS